MARTVRESLKSANAASAAAEQRASLASAESGASRANDWCKIAAAYRALLGDEASVRRCLEAGSKVAEDVRGKFQVAAAFVAEARDLDSARVLLIEAEHQLNSHEAGSGVAVTKQWRRLSRTYLRALKDESEAQRCLGEALDRANDLACCFEVAKAWRDWGGRPEQIEVCFDKASEFTETIHDLLSTAEMFHGLGLERERIGDCLDVAYRLARRDLSEIETGYRVWLRDPETADRIALPHVSPEEFVNKCRVMAGWSSDAGGLLAFLSQRIDREALGSIADRDYGDDEAQNMALLSRISDTGLLPDPFPWQINEVLELTRWGSGADIACAFACTLLCLRDAHRHADWSDSVHQTIAVLIESCLALGTEAMAHLEGFLVTVAEGHPWEDTPFLPLVLLGLLLTAAWRDDSDERLPALVGQIVEREKRVHDERGYVRPDGGWLLGLSNFSLRDDVWRELARRILGSTTETHLRMVFARLNSRPL